MPMNKYKDKMYLQNQSESKKFLKSLFEQKADGTLCDIQLQLQGSVVWGHACVLASCSAYFMEYFQSNNNKEWDYENHWCSKKPLVIDLVKEVTFPEDMCLLCVTKIIDFMYSREIFVLKGHFQHFSKLTHFLRVYDLFPLCKKYFNKRNNSTHINKGASVKNNVIISKIDCNNDYVAKDISKSLSIKHIQLANKCGKMSMSASCDDLNDVMVTDEIKIDNNSEQISKNKAIKNHGHESGEFHSKKVQLSQLCNLQDSTSNLETSIKYNNRNKKDTTSHTIVVNNECELVCCKTEIDISSPYRQEQGKKRKMSCEICAYSSVSVNKILKHLENTNHFRKVCPVCYLQTQILNDLKEHLKEHVNLKPYICQICKKRSRHWEYHKVHMRVHCRNKQFHCEICKKSFKRHQNLKAHLALHERNYLCKKCDYLTSDIKMLKLHILKHRKENVEDNNRISINSGDFNISVLDEELKCWEKEKEFHCEICKERFTQKKNLNRHVQLKHFSVTEYSCFICSYTTKRTDILRHHMKKHHNHIPVKVNKKQCSPKNKSSKKLETAKGKLQDVDDIVGVLIPVQLVSANNSSNINAFAVNTCINKKPNNEQNMHIEETDTSQNCEMLQLGHKLQFHQQPELTFSHQFNFDVPKVQQNSSYESENLQNTSQVSERYLLDTQIDCFDSLQNGNITCLTNGPKSKITVFKSKSNNQRVNLSGDFPSVNNMYVDHESNDMLHHVSDKENSLTLEDSKEKISFIKRNEDIWLNEATGELISESSFANTPIHMVNNSNKMDENHHILPFRGKPFDSNNSFQTLVSNETTSAFDLEYDTDDIQSNPKTPQTNVVEFDDPNNFFSWNCLDNSFCSTWVLNEATGELNMVSFNIQHFNNCDDLKLDESTGFFSSMDDDDETALFLNEGTGDLSVIYFNPSKPDLNSCVHPINDQTSQEILETLSEHSNDDDDLLNEELLMASTTFMANNKNETFLNELTGELNITKLCTYQNKIQDNEVGGNESVYLNEETGEISWNVFDQNINSDLLTNDSLTYDFDNSLNCEDVEHFSAQMNEFSSQLYLDTNSSNDWHKVDQTYDTMLNECTGEFVKKI